MHEGKCKGSVEASPPPCTCTAGLHCRAPAAICWCTPCLRKLPQPHLITHWLHSALRNAFAFELLSPDEGEYAAPASSWFSAYSLVLGNYNPDTYKDSLLMTLFFHYFTLFVNVVLLSKCSMAQSTAYPSAHQPQPPPTSPLRTCARLRINA